MRICYLIQFHDNFEQLTWLLKLLNQDKNYFCLSVDGEDLYEKTKNYFLGIPNIKVIKSIPVTWCGFSQVIALIEGLRCAIESFDFDYLINLSSKDIPLKSDSEIKEFLRNKKDKEVFMNQFKMRGFIPIRYNDFNSKIVEPPIKNIFNNKKVRIFITEEIINIFTKIEDSPLKKPFLRLSLYATDFFNEKLLYVRPLLDFEIKRRENFFKHFLPFAGRSWYILSYKVINKIVHNPLLNEFLEIFSTCFDQMRNFYKHLL